MFRENTNIVHMLFTWQIEKNKPPFNVHMHN